MFLAKRDDGFECVQACVGCDESSTGTAQKELLCFLSFVVCNPGISHSNSKHNA